MRAASLKLPEPVAPRLVAVSKTKPVEAGHALFGGNMFKWPWLLTKISKKNGEMFVEVPLRPIKNGMIVRYFRGSTP